MAITAGPFDGVDTSEAQYALLVREFQDSGVVGSPGDTTLKVSGDSTGMNVKVAAGLAITRGGFVASSAIETVTIAPANTNPRIDSIVARFDPTTNSASIVALTGVPASSGAVAAPITQTDTGIHDELLATVAVAAGTVTIAPAAVTDARRFVSNRVGRWGNSTRPAAPRKYALGYNFDLPGWEWHNGAAWVPLVPTWATLTGKPTTSTLDGRNILVLSSAPTAGDGVDGDICLDLS